MFSEAIPALRRIGYDLRLTGGRADAYRAAIGLDWRPGIIAASYDTNVAPAMFVTDPATVEPFQQVIADKLLSDAYFPTFALFRSDREAVSFIPDRDLARDFQLWLFSLVVPDHPPQGIFAGILRAMQGEDIAPPDFPTEILGYEVLDQDGASVTHTWAAPGGLVVAQDDVRVWANELAGHGLWLMQIDRLNHPWWLREHAG